MRAARRSRAAGCGNRRRWRSAGRSAARRGRRRAADFASALWHWAQVAVTWAGFVDEAGLFAAWILCPAPWHSRQEGAAFPAPPWALACELLAGFVAVGADRIGLGRQRFRMRIGIEARGDSRGSRAPHAASRRDGRRRGTRRTATPARAGAAKPERRQAEGTGRRRAHRVRNLGRKAMRANYFRRALRSLPDRRAVAR